MVRLQPPLPLLLSPNMTLSDEQLLDSVSRMPLINAAGSPVSRPLRTERLFKHPATPPRLPFRAATCVCVRSCRGCGLVGPGRRIGWSVRRDPSGGRTTRPDRPRRGSTSTGPRCYPSPIGDPRRDHRERREAGRIPSDLQAAIDSIRSSSVRRPPSQIVIGLPRYSPSSCSMIVLAETWCL